MLEVAEEHDYQIWTALGLVLQGAALTGLGRPDDGVALSDRGIALYQGLQTPPVFWPLLLSLRARGLARGGPLGGGDRPDRRGDRDDPAKRTSCTRSSDCSRGICSSPAATPPAPSCVSGASSTSAANLGLRMPQLRAATRLARLRDHDADAIESLRGVYEAFAEGLRLAGPRRGPCGARRGRRPDTVRPVLAEVAAAALICLDPGHGTAPEVGRQLEPIGPGSRELKIKDGGGAPGEAPVALAIARRTRTLLLARGYRVAMTRDGDGYRGGNRERARFCNARGAALMLRIHADGSTNAGSKGVSTLVPALHRGWTDDVYGSSRRAGGIFQRQLVRATGARDLGRGRTQRPDRLQLGRRPGRARRDRVHDEPARRRRSCARPLPAAAWRAHSPPQPPRSRRSALVANPISSLLELSNGQELVLLGLLVAVAGAARARAGAAHPVPDPARPRRHRARLRARDAGPRAAAGPRARRRPAAAPLRRHVLHLAARAEGEPAADRPARGGARGRDDGRRRGCRPCRRSTGSAGRRPSCSARSSRRPIPSPRRRSRAGSASRGGSSTIIEGESLINDGTALVAYRFAVAAVVSGSFSLWHAGLGVRRAASSAASRSASASAG